MTQVKEFKQVAIQAALKAGRILNKNRGRVKKVNYKGKINIVTEIDLLSEKTIVKSIIIRSLPRKAKSRRPTRLTDGSLTLWMGPRIMPMISPPTVFPLL